ncbi:glycosyltransferase family protein [Crenalkalicoccus roseus]|uniref:glycosyltransferase n=1 Tax=Crenalkalicoccus roseus TaxID=1485588 RepID=UPI00108212D3|nr:glycosyltransferase [Crenalkalicoccus roseus]
MSSLSFADRLSRARRFAAEHGVRGLVAVVLLRRLGIFGRRLYPKESERRLSRWVAERSDRASTFPGIVVLMSTLDWRYPYRQRPQHLAKALAAIGHPVVYVTPCAGHDLVLSAEPVGKDIILCPSLDVALQAVERPTLVLLSTDTRWDAAHLDLVASRGGVVVYDYLDALDDSLSVSPITDERRRLHRRLLRDEAGTVVISVADVLEAEVARERRTGHAVVTNGVDLEPFLNARRGEPLRADMAAIVARGRPIIGYYGSLATWFDYPLLLRLARERPQYEIVTIGPDLDGSSRAIGDTRPENLHVLPGMDYEDLPRHARWFDVSLVPFVINDITLATSPLKIFEYMALRTPIVSTPMPECRKYASVLIGENHEDFIRKVDLALTLRGDERYEKLLLEEAAANAWTTKAEYVMGLVRSLVAASTP